MSKLAAKLTKEDINWRDNTIVLCDGAKYQTNKESVNYMKALVAWAAKSFSGLQVNEGYNYTFKKANSLVAIVAIKY